MHTYHERVEKRGKRGGLTEACDRAISAMARNIGQVVDIASAVEHRSGLDWYPTANRYAAWLAETYGYSVPQAVGVISALSPRAAWDRNVEAAEHIIATHAAGKPVTAVESWVTNCQWSATVHKAWAILDDNETEPVDFFRRGSKTHDFYLNILNPQDDQTVTVDSHAWHVAQCGARRVGSSQLANLTQRNYDRAALAYIQAAKERNLRPCEVQAIAWVAYRNLELRRGATA